MHMITTVQLVFLDKYNDISWGLVEPRYSIKWAWLHHKVGVAFLCSSPTNSFQPHHTKILDLPLVSELILW